MTEPPTYEDITDKLAIRRYLDDHPGSDHLDIAEALQMSLRKVARLCRDMCEAGEIKGA